jgi:outer membrane protein
MKIRIGLLLTLAALTSSAAAEDLLQVYRDAQQYDAAYAGARNTLRAGRERLPQGRAQVLPTLNLTGDLTHNYYESDSYDPRIIPSFNRNARAYGYLLTFTQPIFRPQSWNLYDQGEVLVRQAEANFGVASQDLIQRVSQAYFDVLAAQDTLALVRAQKVAISEQLAQAKRNFEVGTATITDTHEAQARFDLASAQEIAGLNDLQGKRRALQAVTGREYAALKPVRADVKLAPPNPNDEQAWADLAERQNYTVQATEAGAASAAIDLKRNSNGHLPTVDFIARYGTQSSTGTQTQPFGTDLATTSFSLQLSVPLYSGGALTSREREAAALSLKARDDLDNARRTAALNARTSYLAVINGIAQITALEQARISSQSALDSNKLGYEVGVRINIDVLNAQQQLYSTERDLAVARYNTIINHLRLKVAAGALIDQDLEEVNRALQP